MNTTGFDPDRLTGAGANGAPPSDPNGLGFETSNAYTKRGDAPAGSGYHWMSDYYAGGIVEPHVETDLIATGAMDFDPVDGTAMEYLWTVVTNVSVITEVAEFLKDVCQSVGWINVQGFCGKYNCIQHHAHPEGSDLIIKLQSGCSSQRCQIKSVAIID